MAAFTQRLVSPAETHFTIQHNRAIFRSHLQLISTPARSAPRSRLFGFVLFCLLLYFDATSWGTLPCPLRMDRLCQSRRTKRIRLLQRTASLPPKNQGFVSVSTLDNHLASSGFFSPLSLGCRVSSSLGKNTLLKMDTLFLSPMDRHLI